MNTPTPRFDDPSDARLHAALRNLPDLQAPDTLIPGVLATIRARALAAPAPWYRRPATTWPGPLRIGLGVAAAIVLAGIAFAPQLISAGYEGSALQLSLTRLWETGAALLGAARTLLSACATAAQDTAGAPLLIGGAAVVLVSYFALLGIGGAVWRTASHARRS